LAAFAPNPSVGTQNIITQMLARLPKDTVRLNHAVDAISQKDGIVTVTTKNGQTFQAKKAIVTIPPVLWTSIKWSPPLPGAKTLISNSLAMPAYSKMVFVFDRDWWRPRFSGAVLFVEGPIQFIRETSVPAKACWTLTCFATGEKGFAWGAQSKAARRQSAWQALTSAFAGWVGDIPEPVAAHEMLWERQEYFWGAPSASWPPGMLSKGLQKDLKAPHHNVHFAGSETATSFKGYMEGGLQAAHRAVGEVFGGKL
jgi:monoamine oxidase